MRGWIFDSEQDAVTAIADINAYFGIPVSPDSVTQTYTEYLPWGDAWAIMEDESLVWLLGDAVELPELNDAEDEWTPEINGNGLEF